MKNSLVSGAAALAVLAIVFPRNMQIPQEETALVQTPRAVRIVKVALPAAERAPHEPGAAEKRAAFAVFLGLWHGGK